MANLIPPATLAPRVLRVKGAVCPFLKKNLDTHRVVYSRSAAFTGKREEDPAVFPSGLLKDCDQSVFALKNFCDANFIDSAGAKKHARSRSGIVLTMCGGAVLWHSKLQGLTARHTQEAEYISLSDACRFGMIVVQFLEELGFPRFPIQTFEDNDACGRLATELVNSTKSQHILMRFHYAKECILHNRVFELFWVPTKWQVADVFTKALPGETFSLLDRILRGVDLRDIAQYCKAFKIDW